MWFPGPAAGRFTASCKRETVFKDFRPLNVNQVVESIPLGVGFSTLRALQRYGAYCVAAPLAAAILYAAPASSQ